MEYKQSTQHGLVISDLEHRCYLYLIGDEFEKLHYEFADAIPANTKAHSHPFNITRIKHSSEVSEESINFVSYCQCEAPAYKKALDKVLSEVIAKRLEHEPDFLRLLPHLVEVLPFYQEIGGSGEMTDDLMNCVYSSQWLCGHIVRYAQHHPQAIGTLDVITADPVSLAKALGFTTIMLNIPHWIEEDIRLNLHPSLCGLFSRLCSFIHSQQGASLVLGKRLPKASRSYLHTLASINAIPLLLLVELINQEINALLEDQYQTLAMSPDPSRLSVVEHYTVKGDILLDVLSTQELIKPFILDTIDFAHFDPLGCVMGYAQDSEIVSSFFQAQAYSIYDQLFRSGRISTTETAAFLKYHAIDKQTLLLLNGCQASNVDVQLQLVTDKKAS